MVLIGSRCLAQPSGQGAPPVLVKIAAIPLAAGVEFAQYRLGQPLPLLVNELRVDLSAPGVTVGVGQANGAVVTTGHWQGRQPLSTIVKRAGAIAGVNANFFPFTGMPIGLAIRNGEIYHDSTGYRMCVGFDGAAVHIGALVFRGLVSFDGGRSIAIGGINRAPLPGETVLVTSASASPLKLPRDAQVIVLSEFDQPVQLGHTLTAKVEETDTAPAGTPILPPPPTFATLITLAGPAQPPTPPANGVSAAVTLGLYHPPPAARGDLPSRGAAPELAESWQRVATAVEGGPWLVRNGQISIDATAEHLAGGFTTGRHARTGIGVLPSGELILVTVDDYAGISIGATLPEFAAIMQQLGARNAVNMDGGGSTSMVVAGAVVNGPADGAERPLADALVVYASPSSKGGSGNAIPTMKIVAASSSPTQVPAGTPTRLQLVDAQAGSPQSAGLLWGTADGDALITQDGTITGVRSGPCTVVCRYQGAEYTQQINVMPGAPAELSGTMTPAPNNPPDRNEVVIALRDRYGNGIQNTAVQATVSGGQLLEPLQTDVHGKATAEVVWDANPGSRSITLHSTGVRDLSLHG
ncbi:MAG: phosphodiester glycosidase family protein [Armatimonadetes bacterium]|nr:phosphodiester glycosidase family protein [Armatimonadota bacterium]MDE2206783.1 phosphodiester glycosidase family protein [Armatimonadota bacterium]